VNQNFGWSDIRFDNFPTMDSVLSELRGPGYVNPREKNGRRVKPSPQFKYSVPRFEQSKPDLLGPGYYSTEDLLSKKMKTNVNLGGGGDRFLKDVKEPVPGPGYYNSTLGKDYIQKKSFINRRKVKKSTTVQTFESVKML